MGLGTLAYGGLAGMCAATAVILLVAAARSRAADLVALPVGLFALVTVGMSLVTLWLHSTDSVADYQAVLHGPFSIANLVSLVASVYLVAAWTGYAPRWWLAAIGLGVVALAGLVVFAESGVLTGEVSSLRRVELLGEGFRVHEAGSSPWRPVLDVVLLVTFAYVAVAVVHQFRSGARNDAGILTAGIVVMVALAAHDSLVDQGRIDTTYLGPFGLVVIVVGAAVHIANRVAHMRTRLHDHAVRLEEMVATRTAALIDANDQLERSLANQRVTAEGLTRLTGQVEELNALADVRPDPDELASSLQGLLGRLGELVGARSIAVHVRRGAGGGLAPERLSWQSAGCAETDHRAGTADVVLVEPLDIGDDRLGEMTVRSQHRLGEESTRYVQLAGEHLAGFLHRLSLIQVIATNATDAERHRIARELHDSVSQRLYSVAFLTDALPRVVEQDPALAVETAGRVRMLLLSSLAELRSLLFELQPEAFEAAGLHQLLDQLADTMRSTFGVTIDTTVEPVPRLPVPVKLALYRIAQEALANACRHSGAESITVTLGQDRGGLALGITDHGVGFEIAGVAAGHGLGNLQARADEIAATLTLSSAPAEGTTVEVRWASDPTSKPTTGSQGESPTADSRLAVR